MNREDILSNYSSILDDFLAGREEEAFFAVDQLGKELVQQQQGPDVLIDVHSEALKAKVAGADPFAISKVVVNANELLLNAIMGYALTYYTFLEQLNIQSVKLEQAKAEALQERNKLDEIVSAIEADLLLIDREMNILWVNRRLDERLRSREVSELIGNSCRALYCHRNHGTTPCPATTAFATGDTVIQENPITQPDGTTRYYSFTCNPIRGKSGEVIQVLELVQDITERKNLENRVREKADELKAANEELKGLDKLKSMFIASMSHELRTPLNAVIGFSNLMIEGYTGEINEEQRRNLERILRGGHHLLSLVDNIIDISKIESGNVSPRPEGFSLYELVDEVRGNLSGQAKEKGLTLDVSLPKEDTGLTTDRMRLLQCLLNYMSNAVKFTERGRVMLRVECLKGERILFTVEDSGVGISKEDAKRLFQSFSRITTAKTAGIPGTGLGLYLTRKIAREILGGETWVKSTPGTGSTFGLEIPMRLPLKP